MDTKPALNVLDRLLAISCPDSKKEPQDVDGAHGHEGVGAGGSDALRSIPMGSMKVKDETPPKAGVCSSGTKGVKAAGNQENHQGKKEKKHVDKPKGGVAAPGDKAGCVPGAQGSSSNGPADVQPSSSTPENGKLPDENKGKGRTLSPRATERDISSATLLLLGDCTMPLQGNSGPPMDVLVTSILMVGLVDGVPVFLDLASKEQANRICMLDIRVLENKERRLCIRSLSARVSLNGKPVGDKWQALQEGDAVGLGHADGGAEQDTRIVYAVTYEQTHAKKQDAIALAFARDSLSEYSIDLPLDAVEEAGVAVILNRAGVPAGGGDNEQQTKEPWASRAQRARHELLAVGSVSRAIVDAGRRHFVECAKDEARARGVSFGKHTDDALGRVGIAIAKFYESSGFTTPPAMYWALEGILRCNEALQREQLHAGEMESAASKLRDFVVCAVNKEEQVLETDIVDRIVNQLVEEFDQERVLDPETELDPLVTRVWEDFGLTKVQSFLAGSSEWTRFHLDLRVRVTAISHRAKFARKLEDFFTSLKQSRGNHFSLDILNHALSLALAKNNMGAVEYVLSELSSRAEVTLGTFQAWVLQALRHGNRLEILQALQEQLLIEGKEPLLTRALVELGTHVRDLQARPVADVSAPPASAFEATVVLDDDEDDDELEVFSETEDIATDEEAISLPHGKTASTGVPEGSVEVDYDDEEDEEAREEQDRRAADAEAATLVEFVEGVAAAADLEQPDVSKDQLQKSWCWCTASFEISGQLAKPRAAKRLRQDLARVLGLPDDTRELAVFWEQAAIFDDCPVLVGFRLASDARRVLQEPSLKPYGLAPLGKKPELEEGESPEPERPRVESRRHPLSGRRKTPQRAERSRSRDISQLGQHRDLTPPRPRGPRHVSLSSRVRFVHPQVEPHAPVDESGIMVVYKPAFWTTTTTTTPEEEQKCHLPRVQGWLRENRGDTYRFLYDNPRAGLVHRLDVQTSGPVLVGTNQQAFEEMRENLHRHTWYKEYLALMHGAVPPRRCCGSLEYKLFTKQDRGWGWRTEVNAKKGEIAITRYEAVEAYRCESVEKGQTHRYTLVRMQLITGRTHQIRVHLQEFARDLGLPVQGIVGDYKYLPREQVRTDKRICGRVFLHAHRLHFPMPGNKAILRVRCPLPPELQRTLSHLELDERLTAQFRERNAKDSLLQPLDYNLHRPLRAALVPSAPLAKPSRLPLKRTRAAHQEGSGKPVASEGRTETRRRRQ